LAAGSLRRLLALEIDEVLTRFVQRLRKMVQHRLGGIGGAGNVVPGDICKDLALACKAQFALLDRTLGL
jgi:hypothetical protein